MTGNFDSRARVTFRDPAVEVEVSVGVTLLEASTPTGALKPGHCGGRSACGGCHVRIEEGAECLSAPSDAEEDQLDRVFDVRNSSRLACQARIIAAGDIVVHRVIDD